jgi:ribonuclease D
LAIKFIETFHFRLENPYSFEIDQLQFDESLLQLDNIVPTLPKSVDETTYKYIDNLDDLIWLCNYLGKDNRSRIKEIAVDLEHHSYRSFLGFTCLMQISTRYDDYIIDTIKLRSEMFRLNEIFSDWTLIKVLHGADFDVEWLQKDFGIYIVNMFDTGQAARILQYPHFSLSYLLQKFCNVNAQKQYQLADWRQRPLSEALIRYAREDTHYLLYIYDKLKNELINQQKNCSKTEETQLYIVFDKSKALCKKTYRKPIFYSKGFMNICQSNSHLNAKQMKALHDLYTWRDKIARESDESCEYVLKSHQLLKIAELLPREIYGILALCNPLSAIVEAYVHEMHEIVKEAREYKGTNNLIEIGMNLSNTEKNISALMNKLSPFGLINQKESNKNNAMDSIVQFAKYDPDNILNCPHDFPHKYQESLNSDQMDIQQANDTSVAIDEVSKLSLNDILIKPSNKISQLDMPKSLDVSHTGSSLTDLFSKSSNEQINTIKNIKKLEEKVREIKSSMKSPFEFFLPREIRKITQDDNTAPKWNLIKSVNENEAYNQAQINIADLLPQETATNDINMIPLKQQYKKEKHLLLGHDKKKKKLLKNVDFSDAIIEYNKSKIEKINALGSIQEEENSELNDQSQQLNELINKKLSENLKSLSQQVKVGSFEFGSDVGASSGSAANESSEGEFFYDPNNMNKIFSKPQSSKDNIKYDPSSRLKQNKFDKINKRRQTNLVSRAKHNLTFTYKEPNK